MKEILLLTDYKDRFGSKHFDQPYRSGMDKALIQANFDQEGFATIFKSFPDLDIHDPGLPDLPILYTSSEDQSYLYKQYIEDIILGLSRAGANVIPDYIYLRANNNKVFMELLRKQFFGSQNRPLSYAFGTIEDLLQAIDNIAFPAVFKLSEGASGKNVALAKSKNELLKIARKFTRSKDLPYELWDRGRSLKHRGYKPDSLYRNKFIVQEFIPDLVNDWKIYVFFDRYYIFYRPVFKHRGFRASGGGYDNYFYGSEAKFPEGIFDFAEHIYNRLNVPNVSLDVAFDGRQFYLLEFQAVYFGTAGIVYSDEYFVKEAGQWKPVKKSKSIESTYVYSIVKYLEQQSETAS